MYGHALGAGSCSGEEQPPKPDQVPRLPAQVARAFRRRELHVVVDNDHTHRHDEVEAWLANHPRITLPFTLTRPPGPG